MEGPTAAIAGFAVFVCLFSAALAGGAVHARVSHRAIPRPVAFLLRRGTIFLAVIAAVMLGLLVIQLRTQFNRASEDVQIFADATVDLDRTLRAAGPAAGPARDLLFRYTARTLKDVFPAAMSAPGPVRSADLLFTQMSGAIAALDLHTIGRLGLRREANRHLQTLHEMHDLLGSHAARISAEWTLPVLVLCLSLGFASLGLSAPRSAGATLGFAVFALSLAAAAFLVMEYADPFSGVIVVSSEPMENALFALSR